MASFPDASSYLICTACGTQYPTSNPSEQTTCPICDDPRQFTPPTGQSFTTHDALQSTHKNIVTPYAPDPRLTFIHTTPKFAIGQRCVLLRTPNGKNILWDCITLLDAETIAYIKAQGGLDAIVISHPHYYTTHLTWARMFDCPVYLAGEDKDWLVQRDEARQVFIGESETERTIVPGATALKLGGHFPGSLVLLFDNTRLLVADTLVTTPAGLGSWTTDGTGAPRTERRLGRPAGMNSFAFMWSIPNMIPLSPEEVAQMWEVLGRYDFVSTHGAFMEQDIEDKGIKGRVLESMQIQVRGMGWKDHHFLDVKL